MSYRIPNPDDCLHGDASLPNDIHLKDFWRWAFSDLLEDYLKGWFAEWMVCVLAGLPMGRLHRLEFLRYDHTLGRRRLEVKATSRWQSWKVLDGDGRLRPTPKKPATPDSQVKFGNLRTKKGTYNADVYAFCFHNEADLERWDALDLNQWEIYLLSREELQRLGTLSITLKKLRRLSDRMTARAFQERLRDEIRGH